MNQVANQIKYVLIKAVKNARKNAIEVYSMHNEGKSVIAKRFRATLTKSNLWIHDFSFKKCVY